MRLGLRLGHSMAASTTANRTRGLLLGSLSFGDKFCHSGEMDREEKHWVGAPNTMKRLPKLASHTLLKSFRCAGADSKDPPRRISRFQNQSLFPPVWWYHDIHVWQQVLVGLSKAKLTLSGLLIHQQASFTL